MMMQEFQDKIHAVIEEYATTDLTIGEMIGALHVEIIDLYMEIQQVTSQPVDEGEE